MTIGCHGRDRHRGVYLSAPRPVNTLTWAHQIRTRGVVRWPYGPPYGPAVRSLIYEHGTAALTMWAQTEDRHAGMKRLLTGPEAIT